MKIPIKPLLQTTLTLILALALLLASGCRKEDEECYDPTDSSCANYDPCWEKEAVSAAFAMEERVAHFDSVWYIPTDTILEGGILRLRALQSADSVRWQMSGDARTWDSEEFRMQFGSSESLDISLTLWREPDTLCFPDDDGVDSLTRRLTVVPKSTDDKQKPGHHSVAGLLFAVVV